MEASNGGQDQFSTVYANFCRRVDAMEQLTSELTEAFGEVCKLLGEQVGCWLLIYILSMVKFRNQATH